MSVNIYNAITSGQKITFRIIRGNIARVSREKCIVLHFFLILFFRAVLSGKDLPLQFKIEDIVRSVLKDGLRSYRKIGSRASLPVRIMAEKEEGAIREHNAVFVIHGKERFEQDAVCGVIMTSYEALLSNSAGVSHWTPNPYMYGTYTDSARTFIKGHEEKNLRQINTFVVDVDSKQHSYNEILLTCHDAGIGIPTLILETPKGYHVYFVLDKPLYITKQNDYRGLRVAKRISENIKKRLNDSLQVDTTCNDFGFFRMPSDENVRWFNPGYTFSIKQLIDWSIREDDNLGRRLFTIAKSVDTFKYTEQEWYRHIINQTSIKGSKGQYGRNTALMMMALCCYADGWEMYRTIDHLDEVNSNLDSPLHDSHVKRIVNSAFSGKYNGPAKRYIEEITELWGHENLKVTYGHRGFYKHAKKREERERSHLHEWEADLVAWVHEKLGATDTFIKCTQKQICEDLQIPRSTLNKLLNSSSTILFRSVGKGRNAYTEMTTVAHLFRLAISAKHEQSLEYHNYLGTLLDSWVQNEAYLNIEGHFAMLKNSTEQSVYQKSPPADTG